MATPPNTQEQAKSFFDSACQESQKGNAKQAIHLWQKAIDLAPNWPWPYFMAGCEYASIRDYERAHAFLGNALIADGNFVLARYQLGLLQYTSSKVIDAVLTWKPLLTQAIQDDTHRAMQHFVEGYAAMGVDHFSTAVEQFNLGLPLCGNSGIASDIRMVIEHIQSGLDAGTLTDKTPQLPASSPEVKTANLEEAQSAPPATPQQADNNANDISEEVASQSNIDYILKHYKGNRTLH